MKYKVGDRIIILEMSGEPQYSGKEGVIEYIDDAGQLHGTWGGCAVIPEYDDFEVLCEEVNKELSEETRKEIERLIEKKLNLPEGYFERIKTEDEEKAKIFKETYVVACCICGKEILYQHGHNAEPVKSGLCCDDCNIKVVIPRRVKELKK